MKRITQFFSSHWPLLFVLLVALPTIYPLVQKGFFSFHDIQHVARLYSLDDALWAGQFPVRLVRQLGFGYGYALFNFYPPLSYYLGETFHLLGFGFIDSIKWVWGVALIGSAVSMYFLAKQFWGKTGAAVCAILYLYIPYHAVDAYVRGALAELFSFVWLPLILLGSYHMLKDKEPKWTIWTGVFLALLMLTHNLIFLPFAGFYLLWVIGLVIILKPKVRDLLTIPLSLAIAFGLSAFFFIPALVERQYTLVDQLLLKNLATYSRHFVCLPQLWDSPWGFAGSALGCIDGVSFKIGKLHLILATATLLLVVVTGIRQFVSKKKLAVNDLIALLSLSLALIAIFITTDWSLEIWKVLQPLWYLQFPWRFLEFVALFISLPIGLLILALKKPVLQIGALIVISAAALILNFKYFTPQFYLHDLTDEQATSDKEIMETVSRSSFEFLPSGMKTYYDEKGDLKVSVPEDLSSRYEVKLSNGTAKVVNKVIFPTSWRVTVDSPEGTEAILPIAVFPGWQATVDGQPTEISSNNDQKLLTVSVGQGVHVIKADFMNTPVRLVANSISLVTTVICFILLYESRRSKKSRY